MTVNQAIPVESQFDKTKRLWNDANKATRQRMLEQSNQDKNRWYAISFNFLPSWIREALIAKHKESQLLSNRAPTKKAGASHARV